MSQQRSLPPAPALLRRCRLFFLALLAFAVLALPGRGDVIILKDGYAIHGRIVSEQVAFADTKTGEQIVTLKLSGLNLMDDGPRLTVFSAHYKRIGDVDPQNIFADLVTAALPARPKTIYTLPPVMELQKEGEFNSRWTRMQTYLNPAQPMNPHRIEQQIDILTPHYVRINSISHIWRTYYLTSELGPELVRRLLTTHPDFVEKNGPDGDRRAKLIRFLIQADWLNEADEEIANLLAVLPAEAKRANDFRDTIRELRLDKALADIERAKECGQHQFARKALTQIPKDKLPAKISLKIAGLKAEYDANTAKVAKSLRHLKELQFLTNAKKFKDLIEGADIVAGEMHLDAVGRLDIFNSLAEQAALVRKERTSTPLHAPEELLAAAISGWLIGNAATETSVATARRRLKAREFSLSYLREPSSQKRRDAMLKYLDDKEALAFDELERLISLLPPPEADKDISTAPTDKTTGPLPGNLAGARYLLKLPPEYQHGRPYPLLLVLPEGGERPAEALKRLGDLPAKHGFIVAVVDWAGGFKSVYNYSDEEHALVIGLLRHLRRTVQVDSDKVFVFGDGEGANFALDIGATHPDLFAGIIPMTPTPDVQMFRVFQYWKNFQNLPVYMIVGDRAGDSIKTIRSTLSDWMQRGYPALAVSYKGRGQEYFGAELPYVFDWMSRKSRSTCFPDMGSTGQEYITIRPNSNRFYWIGADEIDQRNLFDPERKTRIFYPAKLQAHFSENRITVNAMGMKQLSIWLGRGTIDFTKPVVVELIGYPLGTRRIQLAPKISVLLEDLYERGDRQRPCYQRIECRDLHTQQVKFSGQ